MTMQLSEKIIRDRTVEQSFQKGLDHLHEVLFIYPRGSP